MKKTVALRKESVDRNDLTDDEHAVLDLVALRKESVDRNYEHGISKARSDVALRKESVDRNRLAISASAGLKKSLSARRAWIEIRAYCCLISAGNSRSPQGERG